MEELTKTVVETVIEDMEVQELDLVNALVCELGLVKCVAGVAIVASTLVAGVSVLKNIKLKKELNNLKGGK